MVTYNDNRWYVTSVILPFFYSPFELESPSNIPNTIFNTRGIVIHRSYKSYRCHECRRTSETVWDPGQNSISCTKFYNDIYLTVGKQTR